MRSATVWGAPVYRNQSHADLAHVVKMSGGRSSAAMALNLARAGVLDPSRGDVALFANTTAEHPKTYEFAAQVCNELEAEHGLPCFWYEYCTVEVAARGGWARRASYRLVTRKPYTQDDPECVPGYRSDGSAFEALTSLRGMLPNRHLRMCTEHLKILPGAGIIAEWLSGSAGLAHTGHHYGEPLTSPLLAFKNYRGKYRGEADKEDYLLTKTKAHESPPGRPRQNWADFTAADIAVSRANVDETTRPKADIWGQRGRAAQFVTLLGLRADEPRRLGRMAERAFFSEGATSSCADSSKPAGELAYAPLGDHGVDKAAVGDFWERQPYDLEIDSAFGNCVFCFMKGPNALSALAAADDPDRVKGTPSDIDWWAQVEEKYARPSQKQSRFLFLGLGAAKSYKDIADNASAGVDALTPPPPKWTTPCCPATAWTERWIPNWSSQRTEADYAVGIPLSYARTKSPMRGLLENSSKTL